MPQYTAPGVYMEEIELGPPPITGVSTSTAGFIGVAKKGPVNRPTLVTGIGDFERYFGNHLDSSYGNRRWLMYAVQGFFENGGQTAYVTRVSKLPQDLDRDTDRTQFAWAARTILPDRSEAYRPLASGANAGATSLDLPDWYGVDVGSILVLGFGADRESVQVTGFGKQLDVQPPLRFDHLAGELALLQDAPAADATTLKIGTDTSPAGTTLLWLDAAGVAVGQWILLGGAGQEVVKVASVASSEGGGGGAQVGLAVATANGHATGVAVTAYNEGAASTLAADPADSTSIALPPATAAFANGDWVAIGSGGSLEAVRLSNVNDPGGGGNVTATTTTQRNAHHSGDAVVKLEATATTTTLSRPQALPLTAAGGLSPGDAVVLWDADATHREAVRLSSTAAPLDLTPAGPYLFPISSPLRFTHAAGVGVRAISPDDTEGVALSLAADAGSTQLALADVTGFEADRVVEIRDAAGPEYVYVSAVDTGAKTVSLLGPTRYRHSTSARALSLANRGALVVNAGPSRPDPTRWPEVGEWGNEISLTVGASSLGATDLKASASQHDLFVDVTSANGISPGTILRLPGNQYVTVASVDGTRIHLDGGLPADVDISAATPETPWLKRVTSVEFSLGVEYGITSELFDGLSLDPRHPRFVETIVNSASGGSSLVRVTRVKPLDEPVEAGDLPLLVNGWNPVGGSDPLAHVDDTADIGTIRTAFLGSDSDDADERTGIYSFLNIDGVSLIAAPGMTDPVIQQALYQHCELGKYTFAVLDPPKGADIATVLDQRNLYDSKYAALYYPWIEIYDTLENRPAVAPPSGHVLGVYANTDSAVGVHQAPANAVVAGAIGLETTVGTAQQGVLNPKGVNAIRSFPGRGIRVWGARTISSDNNWIYVNVRRLFIFLEESIDHSTQYAVFRPNDVTLWLGLKASVTAFLDSVWRSGALQGVKRDDAFFVRVGLGETMTQQDIDEGRVIILVGVAPVKPAEFVVFRIGQKAGGATVSE